MKNVGIEFEVLDIVEKQIMKVASLCSKVIQKNVSTVAICEPESTSKEYKQVIRISVSIFINGKLFNGQMRPIFIIYYSLKYSGRCPQLPFMLYYIFRFR